jgi:NADPH:quinone reductase-like Zn-dependent oxidoreductase
MTTPLMQAFAIDAIGDRGSVRTLPIPEIGRDEIRVRVGTAAVNASDWRVRRGSRVGRYDHVFPAVLGTDYFGVVDAVGTSVETWRVGDRVYGMAHKSWIGGGCFAEFVSVAENSAVARAPEWLTPAAASALVSPWLTSLAVMDAVELRAGATVVELGASGGIGSVLTQRLARAGAHVVAVTRGENARYVATRGAAEVIDYTRESVADAVSTTHPEGVDVLVDMVNDVKGCAALAAIVRRGGQVLSAVHAADVDALAAAGIRGTNVATTPRAEKLRLLADVWVDEHLVLPQIETFPLVEAPSVLDRVEDGHVRGKLVLVVDHTID